jgi:hypothetical protein
VLRKTFAPFAVRKIFLTAKYAKMDTQRSQRQIIQNAYSCSFALRPLRKTFALFAVRKILHSDVKRRNIDYSHLNKIFRPSAAVLVFCSLSLGLSWLAPLARLGKAREQYKKDGCHGS